MKNYEDFKLQIEASFSGEWQFADESLNTFSRGGGAGGCGGGIQVKFSATNDLISIEWDRSISQPVKVSVEAPSHYRSGPVICFHCRTIDGASEFLASIGKVLTLATRTE